MSIRMSKWIHRMCCEIVILFIDWRDKSLVSWAWSSKETLFNPINSAPYKSFKIAIGLFCSELFFRCVVSLSWFHIMWEWYWVGDKKCTYLDIYPCIQIKMQAVEYFLVWNVAEHNGRNDYPSMCSFYEPQAKKWTKKLLLWFLHSLLLTLISTSTTRGHFNLAVKDGRCIRYRRLL